ncbi:MAG: hypothetical protein P0120_12455 [Nitrospira sp.]|nr:hypothetical protein [Nitrospira sp.]
MRMMKRWLRRGFILQVAAVCALSVPISAAKAALVTYSFTGNINIAGNPSVSGSFQFDNATGGSGGVYNGAVTGFTLNLNLNTGTYTSSFVPGANAVTISQNMPLGGGIVDRWALVTAATGEAISGTTTRPFSFDLRLDHEGGGLFTDTSLQDPPGLSSLNGGSAKWRLFFEDADGTPSAYLGSISNLTAVPLPAAVLLFGAGLISLVGLGAGGLRNLRASKA